MSSSPNLSLASSEWLIASTFFFILLFLVLVAKVSSSCLFVEEKPFLPARQIEVKIDGFVEKPGAYLVDEGSLLGDVLRKARPKRFGNLRSIDPSERVKEPLHLSIAPLENLAIFVSGAVVQEGPLFVPVGTRLCGLKKYLAPSLDADLSFFKKRSLLKDGEKIVVPHKNPL